MENINFRGKNVVLKSVEGPEQTIIDGNRKGSVVTFASGEDSTARLEGFMLRNGSGTVAAVSGGAVYGGAIYCSSASPTIIRENVVTSTCGALGGGIAVMDSARPLIQRNIITQNCRGGILVAEHAQPVIGGAPRTANDLAENEGFETEIGRSVV